MFVIADQPNEQLEEGTWANYQGAKFLIAHAGSAKFQRTMSRLQKPFRRKIERNEMDPAETKRILIKALSENIVLGWQDVADSKGTPVKFSRELCEKALTNDEGFREFVMEFSMDLQNFQDEEKEVEGKV